MLKLGRCIPTSLKLSHIVNRFRIMPCAAGKYLFLDATSVTKLETDEVQIRIQWQCKLILCAES